MTTVVISNIEINVKKQHNWNCKITQNMFHRLKTCKRNEAMLTCRVGKILNWFPCLFLLQVRTIYLFSFITLAPRSGKQAYFWHFVWDKYLWCGFTPPKKCKNYEFAQKKQSKEKKIIKFSQFLFRKYCMYKYNWLTYMYSNQVSILQFKMNK